MQLNADLTAAETNRIEKEAIYHLVQTSNDEVVLGLGNDPLARPKQLDGTHTGWRAL